MTFKRQGECLSNCGSVLCFHSRRRCGEPPPSEGSQAPDRTSAADAGRQRRKASAASLGSEGRRRAVSGLHMRRRPAACLLRSQWPGLKQPSVPSCGGEVWNTPGLPSSLRTGQHSPAHPGSWHHSSGSPGKPTGPGARRESLPDRPATLCLSLAAPGIGASSCGAGAPAGSARRGRRDAGLACRRDRE